MSDITFDKSDLYQTWLHSHEEDTLTTTVYRPSKFPFRPSRGRKGVLLRPDGTLTLRQPGAADQTETEEGTWKLEGHDLEMVTPAGIQTLCIESLEPNKLIVRKN